jgi:hypothetical protein
LIGGFGEYKKKKMDKGEHRLRGSIALEGTRKDHFDTFVKRVEEKK